MGVCVQKKTLNKFTLRQALQKENEQSQADNHGLLERIKTLEVEKVEMDQAFPAPVELNKALFFNGSRKRAPVN